MKSAALLSDNLNSRPSLLGPAPGQTVSSFLPLPDPPLPYAQIVRQQAAQLLSTPPIKIPQPHQQPSNVAQPKSQRRFSCPVCKTEHNNQKQFNTHLNSLQHHQAQSINDVLQSVPLEYRQSYSTLLSPDNLSKKVYNRELRCDSLFKQVKQPLLGLEYIIEFQFENILDNPLYVCDLCQCKCFYSNVLQHVLSIQHQKKFMKIHYSEMYDRVSSASTIRCEQQRICENFGRNIESRHGRGDVKLNIQLDTFLNQRPIVLNITHKKKKGAGFHIQFIPRIFEDYDYAFEQIESLQDTSNTPWSQVDDYKSTSQSKHLEPYISPPVNSNSNAPRGMTEEDLLYPFDRQYWYQNYNDVLLSRPIDPHSVTYQELPPPSLTNGLQAFRGVLEQLSAVPNQDTTSTDHDISPSHLILSNSQTTRSNGGILSNRRVILDKAKNSPPKEATPPVTVNKLISIPSVKSKKKQVFDGYSLLNNLNQESAQALLASLNSDDEEDEDNDIMETTAIKKPKQIEDYQQTTMSSTSENDYAQDRSEYESEDVVASPSTITSK
ncbi:unnamed protein product, partial [Didymodactylos carnosus]